MPTQKVPPILPDNVPVVMPELPTMLSITTPAQLRAAGDPLRKRILAIIQQTPRTAKQLATQLGASTGSIGYQLRVLEKAGLAQVVARRAIRGIIAKYYARTARIFVFNVESSDQPQEVDIVQTGLADLREALAENSATPVHAAYPRIMLSPKRAAYFDKKLTALINEMLAEPHDPAGKTYSLIGVFFESPQYVQPNLTPQKLPGAV